MNTPEGKVKDLIKKVLADNNIYNAKDAGAFPASAHGWYYMPVQSSFGVSGIPDFLGNYRGFFWAIEAKAPGKKPTGFQALQIGAIRRADSACFVVDGQEALGEFKEWIRSREAAQEGFW